MYWREGRFPDSPQEWTFYHTGRIVAGDGSEWQIPEQDVKSLFQVAEGPDFWELGNKYTLAGECLDCFTQTLTVYYQGEIKEITVIQEPLDLPVSLRLVLDKVSSMASSQ